MRYFRLLIVLIFIILLCGCDKKNVNEFYKEYSKYNGNSDYINVTINDDNIYKYVEDEEITNIISKESGVIFIGNSNDNLSRVVVNVLNNVIENTDIDVIYYNDNVDSVGDYITDKSIPMVIFAVDGKVDSYHIGTIDNKIELSDEEEIDLYNIYLDGVHSVLGDVCDERC